MGIQPTICQEMRIKHNELARACRLILPFIDGAMAI